MSGSSRIVEDGYGLVTGKTIQVTAWIDPSYNGMNLSITYLEYDPLVTGGTGVGIGDTVELARHRGCHTGP